MAIRLETPCDPDHFAAWKDILWRVSELAMGVDEIEHFLAHDHESCWILAFLDDLPVGIGVGRPSSLAGANFAMVRVLPEARRQGVGTALLESISEHARAAGRNELWGRIRADDAGSLEFAGERGFHETGRERDVVLDVERAPIGVAHVPGIEFTTLAERPDLVRAVYELDVEVTPDVPAHGDQEPMTFERWHASNLEGPGAMPEAYVVALDGDQVVGYTGLRRRGSDTAEADNKPELEIFADDVTCGHGATTGALDESLLFYLRARGLSEKEAQALLIQAFVGEAIESIVNDDLRELAIAAAQRWLEARG